MQGSICPLSLLLIFFNLLKALEKKKLIAAGLLDKFGKTNDQTPKDWKDYKNYRLLLYTILLHALFLKLRICPSLSYEIPFMSRFEIQKYYFKPQHIFSQIKSEDLVSEAIKREKDAETTKPEESKKVSFHFIYLSYSYLNKSVIVAITGLL